MLGYSPSGHFFFRPFIMLPCLILTNAFSASVKIIIWFLSLHLFMCFTAFIDICMLNRSVIMVGVLLISACICLQVFCWKYLHVCSLGILVWSLFCCCYVLSMLFGYWLYRCLEMLHYYFLNNCRNIACSSLKVWKNSIVYSCIDLGFLYSVEFLLLF